MSINFKGEMPVVNCKGDGRVKQEFAKRSDINEILKRYKKSGVVDYISKNRGVFADVSGFGDFRELVQKVRSAHEAFEGLPASLRFRFHNDPAELLVFIKDASNRPEAIKLGLIEPPPAPTPKPEENPSGEPPAASQA